MRITETKEQTKKVLLFKNALLITSACLKVALTGEKQLIQSWRVSKIFSQALVNHCVRFLGCTEIEGLLFLILFGHFRMGDSNLCPSI